MVGNKSLLRVIVAAQKPLLFLNFNSMKKPFVVLLRIGINLHGISSRTYIKMPPPLACGSDLKILCLSMLNCMEGNNSSSFVFLINTPTFPLAIAIK